MSVVWQAKDDGSLNLVDSASGNIVGSFGGGNAAGNIPTVANGSIDITDTTAKVLFTLPVGAVVNRIELYSDLVSNAVTTATVSVGKDGTPAFFLNAADVKAAAGQIQITTKAGAGIHDDALVAPLDVMGVYADTGGAATTGGPFWITMHYHI